MLVGTQMIAKGHDFRRITLVAAVNPDGALFSSDFRAPERLFSLLMQSAGRAGPRRGATWRRRRDREMWIQTYHPQHPLFAALRAARLPGLRRSSSSKSAQPPACRPSRFQALVRADARTQEAAQAFLNGGRAQPPRRWRAPTR